jgi:DNA-binding HxlR family transcriptional regulator
MGCVLQSKVMKALEARKNPVALEITSLEPDGEMCPVIAAIELLQEKWVLFIIRSLLEGAKGFNELRREVGGCNPSTLSERLDTLEKRGIITKTVCSTMPPRTSYELTCAGFALQNVLLEIDAWSRQHLK